MEQKWIHMLAILAFYQKITSGAGEDIVVQEGHNVDIKCRPSEPGSMIIWFRVLDKSGMEFIASFSNTGMKKPNTHPPSSTFIYTKISQNILTLQSFNKTVDSGVYCCATLFKGTEMRFGEVTRLVADKEKAAQPTTTTAGNQKSRCTETPPCKCSNGNTPAEARPSMFCNPLILGPLAGGCGLLLLLLIISTVYCNKIRTKRCPHHYKRRPRAAADGKQMPTRQY